MKSTRFLVAAVLVLSVTAAGQAAYISSRPAPAVVFDYPAQRVLNAPVPAGGPVKVRGTKCSTAGRDLTILTTRTWVTVDPPGVLITEGQTQGVRKPGCVTREFTNLPPSGVTQATLALYSDVLPCVSWRITGRDVPTDPAFQPGVWTTEPFDICP